MVMRSDQKSLRDKELLVTSQQELACLKFQLEAKVEHAITSVAGGGYSNAGKEDFLHEINDLVYNNAIDMAVRVLELMELIGTPEDYCIGFKCQETEWMDALLWKLWYLQRYIGIPGKG